MPESATIIKVIFFSHIWLSIFKNKFTFTRITTSLDNLGFFDQYEVLQQHHSLSRKQSRCYISKCPLPLPKRQANPAGVLATINAWLNDISVSNSPCLSIAMTSNCFSIPNSLSSATNANLYTFQPQRVNVFLSTLAKDHPNAVSDAHMAFNFASDEPNQLMALSGHLASDDKAGQNAASALRQVFPMVPAASQAIADSGGDQGIVSEQVAIINSIRSVDILSSHIWQMRSMRNDMYANVGVVVLGVRLFCHKSGFCSMRWQETMDWGHKLLRLDLWSAHTHLHLLEI
jgi:hypothetical protein